MKTKIIAILLLCITFMLSACDKTEKVEDTHNNSAGSHTHDDGTSHSHDDDDDHKTSK